MRFEDYPLTDRELSYTFEDGVLHCIPGIDEFKVLQKSVARRVIKAASGGPALGWDEVHQSVDFLSLDRQLATSVGFPLNFELASVLAESLEESAIDFVEEEKFILARALASQLRTTLGV